MMVLFFCLVMNIKNWFIAEKVAGRLLAEKFSDIGLLFSDAVKGEELS